MCTYILIMKIQKETKPIFPYPNFQPPTVLTERSHFKELLILNNTFFQSLSEHSMKHSKQQEVRVSFTVHIPTEGQQQGKKPTTLEHVQAEEDSSTVVYSLILYSRRLRALPSSTWQVLSVHRSTHPCQWVPHCRWVGRWLGKGWGVGGGGGGNLIPVRVFADGAEPPSPWQRRRIRRGQAAGQGHPYWPRRAMGLQLTSDHLGPRGPHSSLGGH